MGIRNVGYWCHQMDPYLVTNSPSIGSGSPHDIIQHCCDGRSRLTVASCTYTFRLTEPEYQRNHRALLDPWH